MNYTLHQLQVFLKITQTKSITKAAEELHLTQPAVSIQLRNFQDQFDIPLTEIVGRQLYVTDFGNEIAAAAQRIIDEVNAINFRTSAFKGMISGRLRISVVSTGKYVMPYYLSDFMNTNKGVALEMDVTNKSKVVQSLKENKVDFALVSVLPKDLLLEGTTLLENKLFLVASKDLVTDHYTKIEDIFTQQPLIYREDGSATRMAMEQFLSLRGITVGMKLQLTSNEAVKQSLIAGLGISIMPLIGIKNELERGELKIIAIKGLPITTDWRLVWLKNKSLSPVAKAYLDFIETHKASIFETSFSWLNTIHLPNFH
ncbi:LysR family transcriptional regulator [Flavobacterium sp.]|uniref:LysR family transcriptional regulator n=1 Tax=Flavobacterium sp. TaxID=239 RepID=UPI00260D3CDF|nr:LysR family transcriptional regulator [Flavobacterium sp.]